ncbi:complex I subunit 4 family protein [Pontibacillus marinus]|uniref:NADH:ubiquinone oxidoreductase subunit M n=1 Tax=Pontibacillus marinus BH030004 = DSM 16465 TaxID=1385511 RepID=A0A0A5G7Z7_9BACI|nr:NADH-quinone oxidoreductase subunit M [Pontibacillus marinus]KGX87298.1 NADH:ubiquinone oxidoreductase subunit M [Pontibacillus marinus BH030004 = DSM 16465]
MSWLSLLVFSPLIGILLLTITPKHNANMAKLVGVIGAVIPFLLSLIVFQTFHAGNELSEKLTWMTLGQDAFQFTINYELGVNGFSLILLLLTTLISLLSMVIARTQVKTSWRSYYILCLLLELGILGVFAAENLILFFIFFELTLLPMFLLIGKWGGLEREKAAYSYLIYNGLGSAALLIVFVALIAKTGTSNMTELMTIVPQLDDGFRMGAFIGLLLAFGVKLPIIPLHTWMVRVHVYAPTALVMIHAGVLLKIGAYGLIRFGLGFFPAEFENMAPLIAILGIVNLLYGAFIALVQQELRRILAYSSVSHMGIVLIGIAAVNEAGVQGAIFQTVSHGLIAALFFLLVGVLIERTGTTELKKLGGLAKVMPVTAGVLLTAALASLGLPGMSGFVSEFMAFLGLFETLPILAAIGTLGLILTAVYMLRAVLNITFGEGPTYPENLRPLSGTEGWPVFILLGMIVLIGVYPTVLTDMLSTTLETILIGMGG